MAVGDPGVFICGPEDIAPWESAPAAGRRPPHVDAAAAPVCVWLVQLLCRTCVPGYYCHEHGPRNWWLENYRPRPQ